MTTYACPRGHDSQTDDFCDTCGSRIAGAGSAPTGSGPVSSTGPLVDGAPPPATAGAYCPHCAAPQGGPGRFCEDCGYDYETGKVPTLAAPPPTTGSGSIGTGSTRTGPVGSGPVGSGPVGSGLVGSGPVGSGPVGSQAGGSGSVGSVGVGVGRAWTATVTADQGYFAANAIEGVEFPAHCPPRTFTLPAPQVRIGRRSASKGTDPEMDLSAPPLDPGVSHSHALLTLDTQGVWQVCDLGSTNGTYLNDEPAPLPVGQSRSLADGDRVHVGAWTTITLHAPS